MGGSKSAKGGPNPLADMDRGGPNPLADMDPGVQIRGGPKSAVTPALRTEVTQRYRLPKTNLKLEISALKRRRGISKETRNNQGVIIQYTN